LYDPYDQYGDCGPKIKWPTEQQLAGLFAPIVQQLLGVMNDLLEPVKGLLQANVLELNTLIDKLSRRAKIGLGRNKSSIESLVNDLQKDVHTRITENAATLASVISDVEGLVNDQVERGKLEEEKQRLVEQQKIDALSVLTSEEKASLSVQSAQQQQLESEDLAGPAPAEVELAPPPVISATSPAPGPAYRRKSRRRFGPIAAPVGMTDERWQDLIEGALVPTSLSPPPPLFTPGELPIPASEEA
jgi:hypothetical protein